MIVLSEKNLAIWLLVSVPEKGVMHGHLNHGESENTQSVAYSKMLITIVMITFSCKLGTPQNHLENVSV